MTSTLITAIATIVVAIISLIGIIVQAKTHNKMKSQEDLLTLVDQKIDSLKTESKKDDERLNLKLDQMDMENCKRFLIVEMTKISRNTYNPTDEQRRIMYETHERYNSEGGNSYVDNMFNQLVKENKL